MITGAWYPVPSGPQENNLRYHKGCCLFGLLRSLGARRAGHEYLLLFIARES